jgi:CelD/BcsL family acetyltransferase involved in cellulose biosynthesis
VAVHIIDPLVDVRWDQLLLRHQGASVFHTRGWLSALQQTYDFTPVAFTTSAPGEPLDNALVLCDVKSWITGRRLVSLPFSDHCDPLIDPPSERSEILAHVREHVQRTRFNFAEIRPISSEAPEVLAATELKPSEQFYLHKLSLDPPLESLFRKLHKDCIQRKVRRAERESLGYVKGRSESLLGEFYHLLLRTRRRQGLPPQPLQWFRSLIASMGDQLTVRLASKGDRPVAAILTLAFKNTVTYKYGCSDEGFNHLGGTPFLFWKTIQEAKEQGMTQLDLGRSELDNAGLVKFKDRLGASRRELQYYRLLPSSVQVGSRQRAAGNELTDEGRSPTRTAKGISKFEIRNSKFGAQLLKRIVCHLPDAVLVAAGRLLYRHMG